MNIKKLYLPIIILISILGIAYTQRHINHQRKEDYTQTSETALNDLPPIIAFCTVALGGFRSILADILWLKSISLQEEGKYFELSQLASWIIKLQPKSTGAISFLAWNMAYNISVVYTDHEQKWQWVENGINLLKDAIRYNPKKASLYKELAWLYVNKIGDRYDSANLHYKIRLAINMDKIIGNGLGQQRQNEIKVTVNMPSDYNNSLKQLILKECGLDLDKMLEIDSKFGGLDWRLYSSLAIYWSYLGMSISKNNKECQGILSLALVAAVLNGKILHMDHKYNSFLTSPDFNTLPIINRYLTNKMLYQDQNDYINFYFSFVNKVIPVLWLYGNYKQANDMFNDFKKTNILDTGIFSNFEVFITACWDNYFKKNDKEQVLNEISQYIKISYILNKKGELNLAKDLKNNCQYIYNRYLMNCFNNGLPKFQDFYSNTISSFTEE